MKQHLRQHQLLSRSRYNAPWWCATYQLLQWSQPGASGGVHHTSSCSDAALARQWWSSSTMRRLATIEARATESTPMRRLADSQAECAWYVPRQCQPGATPRSDSSRDVAASHSQTACCGSRDVAASHSQVAVAAAETLRRRTCRLLLRQQGSALVRRWCQRNDIVSGAFVATVIAAPAIEMTVATRSVTAAPAPGVAAPSR